MKTERRHELQTNYLASYLAVWIDKIKPYSTAITLVVGIAIIAFLIIGYLSNTKSKAEQAAWDEFTYAMTSFPLQVDGLDLQAEEHAGTTMEEWATLTWADYQLANASSAYFRDRNGTKQTIKKIRDVYETLLEKTDNAELRNRAYLGLARSHEMSNDLEKARKTYQQVKGLFSGIAQSRLEELNRHGIPETMDWLASAEAIISAAPTGPGTPGQRPLFGDEYDLTPPASPIGKISEGDNVDLLKAFEQATKDTESPTTPQDAPQEQPQPAPTSTMTDPGTTETPATQPPDSETPATEIPATESPATESPETESPAAESPATESPAAESAAAESAAPETPFDHAEEGESMENTGGTADHPES